MIKYMVYLMLFLETLHREQLVFFMFYSNGCLIIQTLNINSVLQPPRFGTRRASNIVKVFLTIDEIYYVMDHGLFKSPTKHNKNKLIETKANIRKLRNMIETQNLTQDNNEVYDKCINAPRIFSSLVILFLILFYSNECLIINILNINTSLKLPHF